MPLRWNTSINAPGAAVSGAGARRPGAARTWGPRLARTPAVPVQSTPLAHINASLDGQAARVPKLRAAPFLQFRG